MAYFVPDISKQFFCIVNREDPAVAAVIASYLRAGTDYVTILEFPSVTAVNDGQEVDHADPHVITRHRATEFNVMAGNALRASRGCENLVLGGLTADQKSYLTFLGGYNVIEIDTWQDADFALGPFVPELNETIACRNDQSPEGLLTARRQNRILTVDDAADDIVIVPEGKEGLVLIEKTGAAVSVIAVHYALSIDADVAFAAGLAENEEQEILFLIEGWRAGDQGDFYRLAEKIDQRVVGLEFENYAYATFFTTGLPYSFILKNVIPFSYVNLDLKPDFFIFNNLFEEKRSGYHTAVVFSPEASPDEETNKVIALFRNAAWYVRGLLGSNATVYNLNMHIREFPFDLLHICSHGGEIPGYACRLDFKDRDENWHTVEYDEVVGFEVIPGEPLIGVDSKYIWRKFDGFNWKSPELEAEGNPHHVFNDMVEAVSAKDSKPASRVAKPVVPGSASIKCFNSVCQANFDALAGFHTRPVIFNNTCWSWSRIATDFLHGGARAYIGTLWKVGDNVASDAAVNFYAEVFNGTLLEASKQLHNATEGGTYEDIYSFWGLHFSTLKKGTGEDGTRKRITSALLESFHHWRKHLANVGSPAVKKNIDDRINWLTEQLFDLFLGR